MLIIQLVAFGQFMYLVLPLFKRSEKADINLAMVEDRRQSYKAPELMATSPFVLSLQRLLLYIYIASPSFHTTDVPTPHKTASELKAFFSE